MENGDEERLSRQLAFITEIDKLKSVLRQSLIMDGSRQENTAEHSWHVAVLAMLLHETAEAPKPDLDRVIRMLLIHDIVEVDAGDTFAYDAAGHADKEAREQAAAQRLFGLLPDDQAQAWLQLWREFEAGKTPEARYANAMDRLMPLMHNYYTGGVSWRRNGVVRSQVVRRMAPIEAASPKLWQFTLKLLDRAVEKGILEK